MRYSMKYYTLNNKVVAPQTLFNVSADVENMNIFRNSKNIHNYDK